MSLINESDTVRIASNGRQCNYWHIAAIKTELTYIWKKSFNLSGYLFLIQRYFNPVAMIFTLTTVFDNLPVSSLSLVVTYTVHLSSQKSLSSSGCSTQFDSKAAIAWWMIFIYDVLLFGLAVRNAFTTRQELHMIRHLKFHASLRVILLRDGAMYFGCEHSIELNRIEVEPNFLSPALRVMTLVNLANILTYYDCMRGGLAPFTSRMMLNLHQVMGSGIYLSGGQAVTETDKAVSHIVFHEPAENLPRLGSLDHIGDGASERFWAPVTGDIILFALIASAEGRNLRKPGHMRLQAVRVKVKAKTIRGCA
ncbi:hypothetical protein C8R42DRAFT_745196 [Lentinula raphanica]|nr:hypothetical protein C8R42DRAFT_745196 [Lentinula raphanica]